VPNDDCTGAIAVYDGQTSFFTVGATTDGPVHVGVCQLDGQAYNDVWYDYTASCAGRLSVSLCGSDYDTVLVVYNSCACPLLDANVAACDDDGCPYVGPESFQSQLTLTVAQGSCYKIRVGGWATDDAGAGTIDISCSAGGDADHDGDVDLDDLVILWSCLGGPGTLLPDCEAADFDDNGNVDLIDVAVLQNSFTGPKP
jgi:hypothetical protein